MAYPNMMNTKSGRCEDDVREPVDSRQQFEAWVKSKWPSQSLALCDDSYTLCKGDYVNFTVHVAWLAWQAATA